MIFPHPAQLLLSSRFVQRRYCFPTGLLMLIRAYPQFPHLIFPASHVNVKIAELDGRKQELLARIAELTVEANSPEQVSQISGYLDTWEDISFDDKRRVVDLMITTIAATSDSLNITWKI